MKKNFFLLLLSLLLSASCAFAKHDIKYRLDVHTREGQTRTELAVRVWNAVEEAAHSAGFATRTKFEEEIEDDFRSPDAVMYEFELGEVRARDDADLELYITCRKSDKAILSAVLVWEDEREDRARHEKLYDLLKARSDIFVTKAK